MDALTKYSKMSFFRRDSLAFYSFFQWIAHRFIIFISFVNGNSCLKDAACIITAADCHLLEACTIAFDLVTLLYFFPALTYR